MIFHSKFSSLISALLDEKRTSLFMTLFNTFSTFISLLLLIRERTPISYSSVPYPFDLQNAHQLIFIKNLTHHKSSIKAKRKIFFNQF